MKSRRWASSAQSSVKATTARRPSVATSRRRVVISKGWPPEIAVTVPCSIPVGTAFSPAAFSASVTAWGESTVAMSMSLTGRPIRVLRTQPPTKRAQSVPPAASRASSTAAALGSVIQGRRPMLTLICGDSEMRERPFRNSRC